VTGAVTFRELDDRAQDARRRAATKTYVAEFDRNGASRSPTWRHLR
jgi:hypothetical protein